MMTVLILKHMGWHHFRYCRLTHRWYGFPPHLDQWNSLDVAIPSLFKVMRWIWA